MKRFWLLFISFTLAVCLIAGCSGEEKSGEAKSGGDVVETLSTSVNQEFTLARKFNLSSGYIWREDYDESMLELVESTIEADEQEDAKIILSQVFRFKALKKGKTEVTLVYRRATLEGPLIARQELISVNIE